MKTATAWMKLAAAAASTSNCTHLKLAVLSAAAAVVVSLFHHNLTYFPAPQSFDSKSVKLSSPTEITVCVFHLNADVFCEQYE